MHQESQTGLNRSRVTQPKHRKLITSQTKLHDFNSVTRSINAARKNGCKGQGNPKLQTQTDSKTPIGKKL